MNRSMKSVRDGGLIAGRRRKLGNRLRTARDAAGFTQKDVARVLGFSDQTVVSRIENGTRGLDHIELENLAHLYGLALPRALSKGELDVTTKMYKYFTLPRIRNKADLLTALRRGWKLEPIGSRFQLIRLGPSAQHRSVSKKTVSRIHSRLKQVRIAGRVCFEV